MGVVARVGAAVLVTPNGRRLLRASRSAGANDALCHARQNMSSRSQVCSAMQHADFWPGAAFFEGNVIGIYAADAGFDLCCAAHSGPSSAMSIANLKDRVSIAALKEHVSIAGLKEHMSIDKIRDQLRRKRKPDEDTGAESDPRDSRIEQLERELSEEQENAAQLRRTVDELNFKIEILEKSYSTQLKDARERAEKAEQALADHKSRLGELDGNQQQAAKSLADLKVALERVTAERDRLRRAVDPAAPKHPGPEDPGKPAPPRESMSIDDILEDAIWAREQERINKERGVAHGREVEQEDGTIEEMLAPDLVLKRKEDSDED